MEHDSQETEAWPSTAGVVFRIFDKSIEGADDVETLQPDLLRRSSLGFRKLIDDNGTNKPIPLKIEPEPGIDCAAVTWVLRYFREQQLSVKPNPTNLAMHCAVLWKYQCIPNSFKNLGKSMQPKSSAASMSSTDQKNSIALSASPSGSSRCWRGKKDSDTCCQLITTAIVLGLDAILENEIKNAVWGSNKKMDIPIAAALGFDLEATRKIELGELFNNIHNELFGIQYDNKKLANSIREILKEYKLGNFWKSWKKRKARDFAEDFEKWKPYDFLVGMEIALKPLEPPTQRQEQRPQAGPRDVPEVNWGQVLKNTKQAIKKGSLNGTDSKGIGGDQETKDEILSNLEDFIGKRQKEIAADLMKKRDAIVQEWTEELDRLNRLEQKSG